VSREPPLSVIAVDHLPSLLPREASEAFSKQLLPSLLDLERRTENEVWRKAEKVFQEKVAELEK
jgi:saccharopine dehydrogenase (NAD+, L-lysine-forming)